MRSILMDFRNDYEILVCPARHELSDILGAAINYRNYFDISGMTLSYRPLFLRLKRH